MIESERRDRILLSAPGISRAAYGRFLSADTAATYSLAGVDVEIGADASGVLVGVDELDPAARQAQRRGLAVETGTARAQTTVDGLVLGLTSATPAGAEAAAEIAGVDHVVLTSPNRDRVIATLCGRLGFDLRLDRMQPWGVHQLFLRRDALLVEVVLAEGDEVDSAGPDALWGIAWRTTDIDATAARMTELGVPISEVRRGAKPGTRVATIKDPELGLPTIVLQQS